MSPSIDRARSGPVDVIARDRRAVASSGTVAFGCRLVPPERASAGDVQRATEWTLGTRYVPSAPPRRLA